MQGELYTEVELKKLMEQCIEDGTFTYAGTSAVYPTLAKFISENNILVVRDIVYAVGHYYYFWPAPEFKDNGS